MLTKNTVTQSLLIYSDMVVFGGNNIRTKPHAHHALEIILAKDSSTTVIHKGKHYNSRGIILKADTVHQTFGDGSAIFMYFNPESLFARQFHVVLKGERVIVLDDEQSLDIIEFVGKAMRENVLESALKEFLSQTFFAHHPLYAFNPLIDERTLKVISFIQVNLERIVSMKELSETACLSESRLFHLFKTEIGIPIRKYILWCRVRKALQSVIDGNSLTQAAQISGFADIAHLNRTFVSFFGVSPSHVLKSTV
ncbi:MAG: AraC family transcriptional regulator [Chryseolinea sp.]